MRNIIHSPKKGDLVRYGDGSTALVMLIGPHAGGWHGLQCMGGSTYVSGPLYTPDADDIRIWNKNRTALNTWCDRPIHLNTVRERPMSSLSFQQLREVNVVRCNDSFFALESKDGPWWGNAMAGECGEACNIVKKIDRDGDSPEMRTALAKELADVVTYADLLAARFDIDLGDAVARKFNEVSARVGSDQSLSESSHE